MISLIILILFIISLLGTWITYALILFISKNNYKEYQEPVSVIIPCYNEEKEYLIQCIESIIKADGKKQIILVNNNSNKPETLEAFKILKNYPITILHESRQGKRYAHDKGLQIAKHSLIVFVDSDTILNKNSILELIKPMQDKSIGGSTGNIILANKDKNWWTKSLNASFWTSFNMGRVSSTNLGYMRVMSGAFCCYRKEHLMALREEYLNQIFADKICNISDDTFLTIRIQTRFNKKIEYQEKAIAKTYLPESPVKFWKTLERWFRGSLRECILLWKEPFKAYLFLDYQYTYFMQIIGILAKFVLIYNLIFHFSIFSILFLIFWILINNFLENGYMLFMNYKEFPYRVIYSFINEFYLSLTFIQALWNWKKQGSWATR